METDLLNSDVNGDLIVVLTVNLNLLEYKSDQSQNQYHRVVGVKCSILYSVPHSLIVRPMNYSDHFT